MKLLLSVCWGVWTRDMILWMLDWMILWLALNSADFKTPQYPYNLHCSDSLRMVFTPICKTRDKNWESTQRSLLGAGAYTCFLSCRRHHLPFCNDSSMTLNGVTKGNSQRSCGCPLPWSFQGQVGCSFERSGLVEAVPHHGTGVGTRWSLTSLPSQTILWILPPQVEDVKTRCWGENLAGDVIACTWTFLPSPQCNREESLLVN